MTLNKAALIAVAVGVWWVVDMIATGLAHRTVTTFRERSGTVRERGRWRSRFVSTVHAIYGTCGAAYVIWQSPWSPEHSLFSDDLLNVVILSGCVGYFLFDTMIMIAYREPDVAYYLHHLIVGGGMLLSMLSEFCTFAMVALTVNEVTTPLINVAWFMQRVKMTKSVWFKINGLLVLVGFFAARICFNVYVAWHYLRPAVREHFPAPIGTSVAPFHVQALAVFFVPLFFLYAALNIMWFKVLLSYGDAFMKGEPIAALEDDDWEAEQAEMVAKRKAGGKGASAVDADAGSASARRSVRISA